MSDKKIILIGTGGHAKILLDSLRLLQSSIFACVTLNSSQWGGIFEGLPVLGGNESVFNIEAEEVELVNGVGSVKDTKARQEVYDFFKNKGYRFKTVIHPSSIISSSAQIGEGVQIMAGSIIQAHAYVDNNSIVNTGSIIEHDCKVAKHVHIAPRVVLCGGVEVKDNCHIGVGASVIQGISIGANSVVGAGAVIVRDVEKNTIVFGVPAVERKLS